MNSYKTFSDTRLAELVNQKDKLAFNILYEKYWERMYFYVRKFVADTEQCEDVIQDVFLSLWTNGFPSGNKKVAGYLYTAVRYRIFDYFDKNKVISKYEQSLKDFLDRTDVTPERSLIDKEMTMLIDREIMALPPKMRRIFQLSRQSELSQKEIAQQLQISDKTVKKQMSNAMKLLWMKLSASVFFLYLFF